MDLDGDGTLDLLSGSWPGEQFFFRGKGKGFFEPAVKLKDKNNKTINVGGGMKRDADGSLLITGDGKFEQKDGKQFVVYEGEWIEIKPTDNAGVTGTASAVHAHDFDGDGDLDLLVGNIGGAVYIIPNEGTKQKWSFGKDTALTSAGGPVKVDSDAGPFVADWDGNGTQDLLVGAGDGSVWVYPNSAARGSGKITLAAGQQLLPAVGDLYGPNAPAEPKRGMRSKVCTADWNGDGRLDLLVGDFTYQKPTPVQLTPEQKAEQDKARAEMEVVQKRYSEVIQRYMDPKARKARTPDEQTKLTQELGEVSKAMSALRTKVPPDTENHGWVWLYLRKPAGAVNANAGASAR